MNDMAVVSGVDMARSIESVTLQEASVSEACREVGQALSSKPTCGDARR